jgi:hypothetical protein
VISALEKLCGPGKALKAEPCDPTQFKGLVESGSALHRISGVAAHARARPRSTARSVEMHDVRNLGEYEGSLTVDARIVADLVSACEAVSRKVAALAAK